MPGIPVVIADFGLSPQMKESLQGVEFIKVNKIPDKKTWFLKPQAISQSPYKYTCWLDTDCEVKKPIESIFDYACEEKLGLTVDPYSYRNGWAYWQTGVVVIRDKPKILHHWTQRSLQGIDRGDQEALYALIGTGQRFVNPMPREYQWLRIDLKEIGKNPKARIIHWTGHKGKFMISKMINRPLN